MNAKLYAFGLSHPAQTGRLLLEYKGIDYKLVKLDLLAGVHDLRLRAAGFSAGTVPAVKIDGRKVQGTRAIARALEEIKPDPPLFPADPEQRRAVEEAERWGDEVLQDAPRVLARRALAENPKLRAWFAGNMGFPLPGAVGTAMVPVVRRMVKRGKATEDRARSEVQALPGYLDHVDQLIADGVIGGTQPNAADFQIASSLRLMLAIEDLRPSVDGRPGAALAMRLLPDYEGPIPAGLVPEWLRPAAYQARAG